jgi:hypothetical protein
MMALLHKPVGGAMVRLPDNPGNRKAMSRRSRKTREPADSRRLRGKNPA